MKIESYNSIKNPAESKLKVKNSIFISFLFPVSSETEIEKILKAQKKKYYDASHICYAYKLLSGKSKYSDAGEPSGSAGIRILNAINHFDLTECLIIVVRYFGGTKLGIGPLGKAYYKAAFEVIATSDIITKQPYHSVEIKTAISDYDVLKGILISNQIEIKKQEFGEQVVILCLISPTKIDFIKAQLSSKLNKEVLFSVKNGIFYQ